MNQVDDDEWIDTTGDDYYFGVHICDEIIPPNAEGKGGVYLGRVHFLKRKEQMKQRGIGAVLSVISQEIPKEFDRNSVKHLHLKFEDDSDEPLGTKFQTICQFLHEQRALTNVYVHCQMGISRSTTALCAYLIKHEGMSMDDALAFIRNKRSCISPNQGFLKQLRVFEAENQPK